MSTQKINLKFSRLEDETFMVECPDFNVSDKDYNPSSALSRIWVVLLEQSKASLAARVAELRRKADEIELGVEGQRWPVNPYEV